MFYPCLYFKKQVKYSFLYQFCLDLHETGIIRFRILYSLKGQCNYVTQASRSHQVMIFLRIYVLVHDLQSHDWYNRYITSTLAHNLMSFAWIGMILVPIFSDFFLL